MTDMPIEILKDRLFGTVQEAAQFGDGRVCLAAR
jgi:hypothetical protein